MALARRGVVVSATNEEYTITDHIWTHGVSFKKWAPSARSFVNLQREGQGPSSASAPAQTNLLRLMGPFSSYPPVFGQKIQVQRLQKNPNQPTRNNTPAQAVCLCTHHNVQRTTSQCGWKQNSIDPAHLKDYYCLCMNTRELPFLASLFLELL